MRMRNGGKKRREASSMCLSLFTDCSFGSEYSISLKTGDELTLEEIELIYMILESNMREKDEQNGKEWNAANERASLFFQ